MFRCRPLVVALVAVLLGAVLAGLSCGTDSSVGSPSTGLGNVPSAPPDALVGRLVLRTMLVAPPEKRALILANRQFYETPQFSDALMLPGGEQVHPSSLLRPALQLVDSGDQVAIQYPDVPADDVVLTLNGGFVVSEADGTFTLPPDASGVLTATHSHRLDWAWDLDIAQLKGNQQLVAVGQTPQVTALLWTFDGPCHMSVANLQPEVVAQGVPTNADLCGPGQTRAAQARKKSGGRIRNYSRGELGSYPNSYADG